MHSVTSTARNNELTATATTTSSSSSSSTANMILSKLDSPELLKDLRKQIGFTDEDVADDHFHIAELPDGACSNYCAGFSDLLMFGLINDVCACVMLTMCGVSTQYYMC